MEYEIASSENGIRLIHKRVDSKLAHCGLVINAGSRDELKEENGLAHFIEHALFKGTGKRKAYHILCRLEDVGGEINAYTTKEETCVHATFLRDYTERAIELIADLVFNSTFPEKELVKEREVIIEEINSYKDNPAELIFDEFDEMIFANETIGRPILGTAATVRSFAKAECERFMHRTYQTSQMVFSTVGDLPFSRVKRLFDKHFGHIPANVSDLNRQRFAAYQPVNKTIECKNHQSHCIIGNLAYDVHNPKRVGLILLNNVLGGMGMNSRLNLSLREKHGFAYNVESSYTGYCDTGILSMYFATDKSNLDQCIELVYKEIQRLQTQKLGGLQLKRAKLQLIGQIAIGSESNESLMLNMGRSCLLYNKFDSLDEVSRKINAVTSDQLIEIANEVLNMKQLSMLIYK